MLRFLSASLLLGLMLVGQPLRAQEAGAEGIEFFETNVRPLLVARCYKCHSHEAENLRGGLLLDTREGWVAGGDSGPTIVPGDPDASLLVKVVRYKDDMQMPPDGKLPEREIAALVEWVNRGAPGSRRNCPRHVRARSKRLSISQRGASIGRFNRYCG